MTETSLKIINWIITNMHKKDKEKKTRHVTYIRNNVRNDILPLRASEIFNVTADAFSLYLIWRMDYIIKSYAQRVFFIKATLRWNGQ